MSPPLSVRTFNLSGQFYSFSFDPDAFPPARKFQKIIFSQAVTKVTGSRDFSLPVLVETLKAVCSDSTEHKLLSIDVPHEDDDISYQDWANVFSVLSGQSSLEAISVNCSTDWKMFNAVCYQIGDLLAESSLEFLRFECSFLGFFKHITRLHDMVARNLSEGLMRTKSLRGVSFCDAVLKRECADVLNHASTANMQNTSLEWIHLAAPLKRLDMVLEALLISNYLVAVIVLEEGHDMCPVK
ncbi:hypothetical protein R1sor_022225 [Riccia sorocarpa]|uniref:Uncharacterized protein n=1 Tax=Riccia sorocarpa TaxID=122646 RepID=A0ABD3GNH8_9MARC